MSLSSLISAAECAVEMSEAAAVAAEEALNAARLAGVHARAALEAAKLAYDLEKKLKSQAHTNNSLANGAVNPDSASNQEEVNSGNTKEDIVYEADDTCSTVSNSESIEDDDLEDEITNENRKESKNNNNNDVDIVSQTYTGSTTKRMKCKNCNLHTDIKPCLHGRFLLQVTSKTIGMRMKTCGNGWSEMEGRLCWVEGGGADHVRIVWNERLRGKVENYSLKSFGKSNFMFWCTDPGDKTPPDTETIISKSCDNCKLPSYKCLNEKFVLDVRKETLNMRVKSCTSELPDIRGVIAGGNLSRIKIKPNGTGREESFPIMSSSKYNFMFDCKNENKDRESPHSLMSKVKDPVYAHRLPVHSTRSELWNHDGEKHRLLFNASENVELVGIGLLVAEKMTRVTVNISQPIENGQYSVIYKKDFYDVQPSYFRTTNYLKFSQNIAISSEKIYLIVLTMIGGASVVGYGGEEFVIIKKDCGKNILLKFEEYKHKDNIQGKTTNVEMGILEKLYFN